MMTGGVQWDAQLGGTETLPQSIHLLGHAAARSAELAQMHAHLAASASNYRSGHSSKLAFQRIPHHMRRRAMSHNVRRLPRRLRDIHAAQMRKSRNGRIDTEQMRRPSRKYRRRPANLITEYTRRRTNVHWLHTHIWHAKRCQMELRWGWRLPVRPTARSYRANYRAVARHCLIQDISFVCCIQLEGEQQDIVNGLLKIVDSSDICVGTTNLTATSTITGNREGTTHARDVTTKQSIGLLTYQWRPLNTNDEKRRTMWLWVHPSFYTQIMSNLHKVFLNQIDGDNNNDCIALESNSVTQISQLRHDLARFRIRGPLATSVLQRVLRSDREGDGWWEKLRTTTAQCVSPRSVYELMVQDTRLHYPQKRTKATVRITTAEVDKTIEAILPIVKVEKIDTNQTSFLWDASIRHQLTINRESNASLVNRRMQLLVPGTIPSPLTQQQQIPMIVIQQPGSFSRGFASGWDLILPTAYAQGTWLALVLWGGRVGGLQDAEHCRLEVPDVQTADVLHPDTAAGRMESHRMSSELERKYWAKPPNRRCNYGKLGVVSPFRAKWLILVNDWLDCEVENFDVLRNRCSIDIISNALQGIKLNNKRLPSSIKSSNRVRHRKQQQSESTTTFVQEESNNFKLLKDLNCFQPTLIYVKLTFLGRGRCSSNALICLPQLKDWLNQVGVEEPLHSDVHNEQARRKLRLQHYADLRSEKRKRKATKRSEHIELNTKTILEKYRDSMRALWVPTTINTVRNSCTREVIGWVTEASFSFVGGTWVALGYIVLPALPRILHMSAHEAQVLLRDTRSRCYKFVSLELL